MNIRKFDIENLSDKDATLLHHALLLDESQTEKYCKIKMFEPCGSYTFQNISFQCNYTLVRTKEGKGTTEHFYTVYSEKNIIGSGGFGNVYSVSGILEHIDGKMVYREENSEVIKKTINNQLSSKTEYRIGCKVPDTGYKKNTSVNLKYRAGNHFVKQKISFNVMKKLSGLDLTNTIHNHPYTILQRILLSINALIELKRLDNVGIIQRDIKPENIKVDHASMMIRIFDFGLAREKAVQDYSTCGSYGWRSPEIDACPQLADETSDVYSMGMVLRMLFGDEVAEAELEFARINPSAICAARIFQYQMNVNHIIDFKPVMKKRWDLECPSVDIQDLENILLHLTQARPEARATIDYAISRFKSLGMQVAFACNHPKFITMMLNNGGMPQYSAFTKAVDAKQWECVLAFVKANPETVENSAACAKAYGEALHKADRNQLELIDVLMKKNAPITFVFPDDNGTYAGCRDLLFTPPSTLPRFEKNAHAQTHSM